MNPKLEELIDSLLEGTQSGVLLWQETGEPGWYRLMFDHGIVRIYRVGSMLLDVAYIGCTVLNATGEVLFDVQIPRRQEGSLVTLYELVDGIHQQDALEALLAEVRGKMQTNGRPAVTGAAGHGSGTR